MTTEIARIQMTRFPKRARAYADPPQIRCESWLVGSEFSASLETTEPEARLDAARERAGWLSVPMWFIRDLELPHAEGLARLDGGSPARAITTAAHLPTRMGDPCQARQPPTGRVRADHLNEGSIDWIERVLHVSPSDGSEMTELVYLAAGVCVVVAVVAARSIRKSCRPSRSVGLDE